MPMERQFDPLTTLVQAGFYLYHYFHDKGGEAQKLLEVIEATHLRNLEGISPKLTSAKTIPTGGQYSFYLPAGVSLKEFVDRKPYFETFTGGIVEIYPPSGPRLIMQVHHMEFPDLIPFTLELPQGMLAPLPIGMAPDGEILWIDLADLPHVLIGGLPGYGKTSWLVGATVALKAAGVEVCAIDRKRIDFPPLSPWINVAESEEDALALVQTLLKENERRQKILYAAKARKIQEYTGGDLPYMCLIVDEAAAVENKATYEGIDSLARLARATGISILLATQKPSAKLWDQTFSNTRDMMAGRISFYVSDYMMSQIILGKGNTAGARLPLVKGRAATVFGDRERIVQTMFLPGREAEGVLESLGRGPYFDSIEAAEIKKPKRGRPRKQ